MNWISLFVPQVCFDAKNIQKNPKKQKEKALVFLMSMQTLFLKLFPQLTMAK